MSELLEKNQILDAVIEGCTSEGLGVARIGGRAVFVKQALPGEKCRIRILKVQKTAIYARVEELLEALRIFINKSKQKRIEKRTAVKEMVLELANANGIVFPEDLAATLDSLDDEQPASKVVNVAGNYKDIHNNDQVNMSDKQKADNGRK